MAPFGPFEAAPALAVGVSGGRDSLALALLSNEWTRARGGRILALIVDHGLRPEAAGEAAGTAALLESRGIAAEILCWRGDKPGTGLQEAARTARYRLLFDACRRHGILHLLVGHQADDQAETVAMRAAHGSGADGLAGMAALVEHADCRLLRPLLAIPRSRLTATLNERAVPWIDDPSNADPRFERVRLRQAGGFPAIAAGDDRSRARREAEMAEIAVDMLEFEETPAASFDRAAFADLAPESGRRLLGRVVQALGRRDYPPRRERLDRAAAHLSQPPSPGKSGRAQDFTLSECRLILRQSAAGRRMRWIVRAENGRKDVRYIPQPLIPAAFFACGSPGTPHLD